MQYLSNAIIFLVSAQFLKSIVSKPTNDITAMQMSLFVLLIYLIYRSSEFCFSPPKFHTRYATKAPADPKAERLRNLLDRMRSLWPFSSGGKRTDRSQPSNWDGD